VQGNQPNFDDVWPCSVLSRKERYDHLSRDTGSSPTAVALVLGVSAIDGCHRTLSTTDRDNPLTMTSAGLFAHRMVELESTMSEAIRVV